MKYLETLKQTGRSFRLLDEAIKHAGYGKHVYVYAESAAEADRMMNDCRMKLQALEMRAKVADRTLYPPMGGAINFRGIDDGSLDFDTLRMRFATPGSEILIDHAALELRFRDLLEHLHRFDAPIVEPNAKPASA